MKKYQIHLDDWQRIFVGEVPGAFYIELIIRSILIYFILLMAMRLMGRKMASQLTRIEMAAMVSLAAGIGVPLQAPDRGLLPAVVIALVVVIIERVISYFAAKNEHFEQITHDNLDVLLEDSVLRIDRMQRSRITTDRLCSHLRSEGFTHLGSVKRVYMEANGGFSIVKEPQPRPGLRIIPDWDHDFVAELQETDITVCKNCGKTKGPEDQEDTCLNCASKEWAKGVTEKLPEHHDAPVPEYLNA
jgi:uncharacterized membrane protein YcaP (DUF421 family)